MRYFSLIAKSTTYPNQMRMVIIGENPEKHARRIDLFMKDQSKSLDGLAQTKLVSIFGHNIQVETVLIAKRDSEREQIGVSNFVKITQGIFLCIYDLVDDESFQQAELLYQKAKETTHSTCPMILIGMYENIKPTKEQVIRFNELAKKLSLDSLLFDVTDKTAVDESYNKLVSKFLQICRNSMRHESENSDSPMFSGRCAVM